MLHSTRNGVHLLGLMCVASCQPSTEVATDANKMATDAVGTPDAQAPTDPCEVPGTMVFSKQRGYYDEAFELTLRNCEEGAQLRYTVDGTTPSHDTGTPYTQPISITTTTTVRAVAHDERRENETPLVVVTHTYLFAASILQQQNHMADETWSAGTEDPMRARDTTVSQTVGLTAADLTAIPSLVIATDYAHLFDPRTGLYYRRRSSGPEWERPASVELIDPQRPDETEQINAGLRIHGASSRRGHQPKSSFRLHFRKSYGAGKWRTNLFQHDAIHPTETVAAYDVLVLKGGNNRSWTSIQAEQRGDVAYLRDQWVRSTQTAIDGVGARGLYVHLYLNDLYWGLYNLTERPDHHFMAAHFGGLDDDYYSISHAAERGGASDRFDTMMSLRDDYDAIADYLDIDQFIDYILLHLYAGVRDWPTNNWYAAISNAPPGKARFFAWDAEDCLANVGRGGHGAAWAGGLDGREPLRKNVPGVLFAALRADARFRARLCSRAEQHIADGGPLSVEAAVNRWDKLAQRIDTAIRGESARWGDAKPSGPYLKSAHWDPTIAAVRAIFTHNDEGTGNAVRFRALLRQHRLCE